VSVIYFLIILTVLSLISYTNWVIHESWPRMTLKWSLERVWRVKQKNKEAKTFSVRLSRMSIG